MLLNVASLSVSFGDFIAVDALSFSLKKGETLAIVGESGSGKSLTALALMGLLPKNAVQSGSIMLHAKGRDFPLHQLKDERDWQQIRGAETAMIFQEPMSALNPVMRIGKQLTETILLHQKTNKKEAKEIALKWLAHVQLPQPEIIYSKYPHQLSGGQKQRVVIAMALCNHPALILADEPTTALDATVQLEILSLLRKLQQEQDAAMIFITHDLSVATSIADQVLVMYRGKAVEWGAAKEVLQHPKHAYTQALLQCRPTASSKGKKLKTIADVQSGKVEPQTGFETENRPPKTIQKAAPDKVLLSVRDLQIWFPTKQNWWGKTTEHFKAVEAVSFDLVKGEVLGLVGESGCGKSTVSRALMGLQPVEEGQILFEGRDLSHLSEKEWKLVRRDIQLVFQDPFSSLNPRMKIGDALLEAVQQREGKISRTTARDEAIYLLETVRLPAEAMHKYPHQFSGGQRQRIGIARALALKPKLLLCDESVSALDVSVQAEILNLLTSLRQDFALTFLFISHDLGVVHYIADRLLVMQHGKIVERGTANEVLKNPQEAYTKKLVAAAEVR